MKKPYVVSADIALLLKERGMQKGFTLPSQEFFFRLREEFSDEFRKMFPSFELVSEEELSSGLRCLEDQVGLPIVSLDRVYCRGEYSLDSTRLVDASGNDCGFGCRFGALPLLQQIRALRARGLHEMAVADDVLFSGTFLERIAGIFSRMGIHVPVVCAGIGIAEGVKRLENFGCEVRCVRLYGEVLDEVCERDFYPGTPFSGRTLKQNRSVGLPYILPFGNPEKWASIPSKHAKEFSMFCLRQTIALFDEIERCSDRAVLCEDLGRGVLNLPVGNARYTEVLHELLWAGIWGRD